MIEERVRELVSDVVSSADVGSLKQRVEEIGELDRSAAMLQAALSVRIAEFADARRAEDLAAGCSRDTAGRGAVFEIAMARRVSTASVDHQLAFAQPLVQDHPQLLDACLEGKVSQAAAKYVVKEAEVLDPDQRHAIDGELTHLASELTPGQTRKAAASLVASTDPDAAAKRARLARARKQVRAIMNGDATGTLLANLPAEQTVACWDALDATARGMRADGDPRSIRELMCDVFVDRLTGVSKPENLNLEVGAVIAASSLFGLDEQPAKLVGRNGGDYGVLPAEIVRQLATSESTWARRLVCDPLDGRLVTMDTKRRRFDGALRRFLLYRDATSRRPYSDSPIYDLDHIARHSDAGPTSAANAQGLGKTDHTVRDLPGWTVSALDGDASKGVTWTSPTGHTYQSRPPPIFGHGNTRRRIPRQRTDHLAVLKLLLLRLLLQRRQE